MSVGRGNRKTRKIHAVMVYGEYPKGVATIGRLTACNLPTSRRYVRTGNESAKWVVNCNGCLRALVDACDYSDFLKRAGLAKLGPSGFPVRKCRRCGEWDEFTSESDAHGICASCMNICNRPSH